MNPENPEAKGKKSPSDFNADLINTLPDAAAEIGSMAGTAFISPLTSLLGFGIFF